mgnify:CR=1 FL=1
MENREKQLREVERLKAAARAMELEALGKEVQKDGKMSGTTFHEIHTSHKAYLVWLMDHQLENPKYVQLIEYARRKEEEKQGRQVDHGDLRLSTKLESLGRGSGTSQAASSAPSDGEWSKILESQENQDAIVNNLLDQLADTRQELKNQREMIQVLDRRLKLLEGASMEMS